MQNQDDFTSDRFTHYFNKKSGFAAPPAAGVRSIIAFLKPCAFLKSKFAFQKNLHGNIIIFYCIGTKFPIQ